MEIIMETQRRLEKRIFLPMDKCQLLVKRITNFKLLYRYYFDFPVSETIYFTLNDLSRSLYGGVYIWVRKYVKFISEKMLLDDTIAYLEMKKLAKGLDFEGAAMIRDEVNQLRKIILPS